MLPNSRFRVESKFQIPEGSGERVSPAGTLLYWQLEGRFVLSVQTQKRLAMISGRRRETGAPDPSNRKDYRDDVLDSVYPRMAI